MDFEAAMSREHCDRPGTSDRVFRAEHGLTSPLREWISVMQCNADGLSRVDNLSDPQRVVVARAGLTRAEVIAVLLLLGPMRSVSDWFAWHVSDTSVRESF